MFSMDKVPFAVGSSPFRCKGILYVDALEYFDSQVEGGRAVLLPRLGRADLSSFFNQNFLVGGWYDVFPLLALVGSASVALGLPQLEVTRMLARVSVPKQFRGLYKFLLKMASPEMTMRNLPRVGSSYFDFVRVDVAEVRPRTYTTSGSGIPMLAAPAYMAVTEIALVTALELAGARGVRHRWLPQVAEGKKQGMDVVQIRRELSWE
jgi:hypothetical protein